MTAREQVEEAAAAAWPRGVCHFCEVEEDRVDGDRIRWLRVERNVCSQPGCIRAFSAVVERALARLTRRPRKLSPGQVHELILEKERKKRREYRERAKAKAQKGRGA